ncbi:zinc finger protein 43-like [Malaya genurostris]|uniref:zinc finger protein 43-like n=1 Tax=Malaya genurostris TaxID=325434 RepID=UPI0026F401E6|nr:zinc finger protein 43-like [Malaya genurostris]
MTICRACGQNLIDDNGSVCFKNYAEIYFHLTSITLYDYEDQSQSKLCIQCIEKLKDFNEFRNICLHVHSSLQNVKVEEPESQENIDLEIECKSESYHLSLSADECFNNESDSNEENEIHKPEHDIHKKNVRHSEKRKSKKKCFKKNNQDNQELKEQRHLYTCEQCPKRFHVQSKYEAHKRTHVGLKPYECETCHRSFTGWHYLRFHRIQKHSGNKVLLTCDHPGCEQQLSTRYALKRHKTRTHDPNFVPETTVFVCDTCGKTFNSNGNLKKHKYTHTPAEMPFVCGICSKQFPTSNKLKEHKLRHDGVKNHTCPQCGLRKTTMHELRQHIKHMHAAPRSVACDICPRRFNNVGSLNVHVRIVHLGEKRHKCPVCEWAFGRSDHLKRHMKSHTG